MNDNNTHLLIDGSTPATAADVESHLTSLGIAYQTITHPAMLTVEDSRKYRGDVPGGYSKNLFLRNKKGRMWLVTLREDRVVDLRRLGDAIGAGRVSFASPERLMSYLGVIPGAVTPMAVINDNTGMVTAVMDQGLMQESTVHFHPCRNTMTTSLTPAGLLDFMGSLDHDPEMITPDQF
ncbi:MAG: prolyl-tRNA synthetase associated domain-containing protein [Gammaproteobacteria bacterium]|nr:prolyl-tRNA synthetase associated domain-containing protein [Gammaproteobacteria bacterium]